MIMSLWETKEATIDMQRSYIDSALSLLRLCARLQCFSYLKLGYTLKCVKPQNREKSGHTKSSSHYYTMMCKCLGTPRL